MTNKAWEFICETPEIKGFLGKALLNPDSIIAKDEKINYEEQFIAPLDLASWALRNELLFVYGRKRAGLPPEHKCTFVSLSKKTQ